MFADLNKAGLFPVNYWALQNTTRLLQPKNGSERFILAQVPQHPCQYGYGIPVVSIYRNEKGDVFEVSSRSRKLQPLKVINPDDYQEMMGS